MSATPKQVAYLEGLLSERQIPDRYAGNVDRLWKSLRMHRLNEEDPTDGQPMTFAAAKAALDWLVQANWPLTEEAAARRAATRSTDQVDRQQRYGRIRRDVPEGRYATPNRGDTGQDYDFWKVDTPAEGQWAGRIFVNRVIGGREPQRIHFSEQVAALDAIATFGIDRARQIFGQEIGTCTYCGRSLTDRISRYNGRGPDCAKARGLTQQKPPATWRPDIKDAAA